MTRKRKGLQNAQYARMSKKTFYCVDCIHNGDFIHSKKKRLERFADKKLRQYKINEEKKQLLQMFNNILEDSMKLEAMRTEVGVCKERLHLLSEHLKESIERVSRGEELLKEYSNVGKLWHDRKDQYVDKVDSMKEHAAASENVLLAKKAKLHKTCSALQSVRQSKVKQLVTHIFPITVTKPPKPERKTESGCPNRKDEDPDDIFEDLEEAQQLMYVQGHWVYASPENDLQYSIVEPCLPACGNYSAYPTWSSQHGDTLPLTKQEICQRDMALGISAALTFTTHLVCVLAHYLDIHMPKRLCYSEFCGHELKEQEFIYKVAKLNANVIYLCLSQNVDPTVIFPQRTLPNLMLLLDPTTSDLGRFLPVNLNSDLIQAMENSLSKDLMLMDDSDDQNDDGDLDWVQIANIGNDENLDTFQMEDTPAQPSSYLPSVSIAGDLISSVASIFRAARGQK